MTRDDAVERTLITLRFFLNSPQSETPMRPATRASTITFSTCKAANGSGGASCHSSIPLY